MWNREEEGHLWRFEQRNRHECRGTRDMWVLEGAAEAAR
jgi:hypothetical protein